MSAPLGPATCVRVSRRGEYYGGVFAQRKPQRQYYVVYPGNTPQNHPPAEGCMINSKQHQVQNSGPWDPWQAVA